MIVNNVAMWQGHVVAIIEFITGSNGLEERTDLVRVEFCEGHGDVAFSWFLLEELRVQVAPKVTGISRCCRRLIAKEFS